MLAYGLDYEQTYHRRNYYYTYLTYTCGPQLEFVEGSKFQTSQTYTELLFYCQYHTKLADVRGTLPTAAVRESNYVSTYTHTLMQVIDPLFLGVDAILADEGQRKIYELGPQLLAAMDQLPTRGRLFPSYKLARAYPPQLYFTLPSDLQGRPMNQSRAGTRISIHETEETLHQKIRQLYAPPAGQPEIPGRSHALLELFKDSVFPWTDAPVTIKGLDGNVMAYENASQIEADYAMGLLHPNDCKVALYDCLLVRLRKAQAAMGSSLASWIDLERVAKQWAVIAP